MLFALFMREEVPDRWDLIVSAPWLGEDRQDAVDYLVQEIKSRLGDQELLRLSRIVVADPQADGVRALNVLVQVEHGSVDVQDTTLLGLFVKRAHIITSKRPAEPAIA